jgi:phosphoribosylglycinamide formyltransferase-1
MTNPKRKSLKLAVLVSGRGSNLQAILEAQAAGTITSRVTLVISNKAEAPALERAKKHNIPTCVITSQGRPPADFFQELTPVLKKENPDLIVLAGFMKILPASVVETFSGRIINIHPSLLPAFPGLGAQKQALEAKASVTGCTVHFVDKGCDTGPIILQRTEPIFADDSVDSLSDRLLKKEHQALVDCLCLFENNKVVLQG